MTFREKLTLEYLKEQKRLTEDKLNVNIVQMRKHKRDIEILDELICEEEEKVKNIRPIPKGTVLCKKCNKPDCDENAKYCINCGNQLKFSGDTSPNL